MKKRIIAVILSTAMLLSLTGCSGKDELNELNTMQALNSEASVKEDYKLSYTDKQSMIYSQVADRSLLDLSGLTKCSDNEIQQVVNYLDSVDAQLCGTLAGSSDIIDPCFTDYLLAEFEKTPYYWQRTKTTVRGMDAESRSIIVDVDYKTIDFEKNVLPKSTIVLGEPLYEKKLQIRYDKWLEILNEKYNNYSSANWESNYNNFIKYYGDIDTILESQNEYSMTEYLFEYGNQKTYEGLIDSGAETGSATMSVRYVLVPNYKMGINLGITCKHMYITNFKLDSDITQSMTLFTDEGYATVVDSIYDLIYSYFQCIDEDDYSGLYKLTYDFGKMDKYYEDMFSTSYRKHNGFTISLFDITGTHITCGVNIASKVRAKGSDMTFPSYTDRYLVELELIDGILQIQNMVLLSREIEGEPVITTDDPEIAGFSSTIDLDNDDKLAIESLICDFSALQLLGDTSSDNFGDTVDTSISDSDLNDLKSTMTSLSGVKKAAWISNYQQGTSNYASVKCKELFQSEDNTIVEANAVYDFILKGGKWYVYDYSLLSSVRLSTTNLATTGCLCLVSPGKVESYTSQIKGTASTSLDNVSDISYVLDHPETKPVIKTGTVEQGLNKDVVLTDEETVQYTERLFGMTGIIETYDEYTEMLEAYNEAAQEEYNTSEIESYVDDMITVLYRVTNNRYDNATEFQNDFSVVKSDWGEFSKELSGRTVTDEDGKDSEVFKDATTALVELIDRSVSMLGQQGGM